MSKVVYLIGSLRNPAVPELANFLRKETGFEIFDSWYSPGPNADDYWRDYSKGRGQSYREALSDYAATHVFEFDHYHINRANVGVLLMPAGKSGHLELGYMIGQGKPCFYLLEEGIERWDVMLQFCFLNGGNICNTSDELAMELKKL